MTEDFVSSFSRAMNAPIPDDGNTVDDLVPFGWAPGQYFCRACSDCGEGYCGDKRCRRCRACAVKAMEAYRNRPTWQSGPGGLPEDRDVWVWKYSPDTRCVELQHGRDVDGEFMLQGEDWPDDFGLENVICWIDAEDAPELSAEAVDAIVKRIPGMSGCLDHIVEDWLHWFALRAVVDRHRDAQAISAAALKTRDLKFSRYYG